jgi:AcrR family transcriptional regulator
MPIIERRKREKLEMKTAILQVARDIAARDGWQNLTIRKICDEIRYTAPVIYQYFDSKDTLLMSLRMEGLALAYKDFEKLNKKIHDPSKRLMEYGLIWWDFAEKNPELYQVIYNLQGVICTEEGKHLSLDNMVNDYLTAFSAINQKARRSEKYRWEIYDNFVSIIHGFISINMVNKIRSGRENARSAFKNALQRFLHSINDTTCPKEN